MQTKPCHYLSPKRTPASQRSLLQGAPSLHQVRSPRLPLESLQRRVHPGAVIRQAAAPNAAQRPLALVVPPQAPQDHDGRAGPSLPVA